MRWIFLCMLVMLFTWAKGQTSQPQMSQQIFCTTIEQLTAYTGDAQTAIVADKRRGGSFYYTREVLKPDNGVVFPGHDGGYWVRLTTEGESVYCSWFSPEKGDDHALKQALNYTTVVINEEVSLTGSLNIPAGKSLKVTPKGSINIAENALLTCDGAFQADDYQRVFKGGGKVVFGAQAVSSVSICWFGAVADCKGFASGQGTDNTLAIQNAIGAAEQLSDVYIPPTAAGLSYRITSTVTVGKKLHFFSFNLHGAGTTITANMSDRASSIFADFTDGSAINIQGSRRVYLTNFLIHGRNLMAQRRWQDFKLINTPSIDTVTYFADKNIGKNYVGVSTDAEKANIVYTADVVLSNMQIEYFYLGIGISQAGNVQGDRVRVENSQINFCTWGISLGNAQNRSCHFLNVDMNHIWCAYTNNTFGNGTGSEFQITGGQITNTYKLFHIQPYNIGQCVVSGLYAEAAGCIGEIGTSSASNNSFLFTGCEFFMQDGGFMGNYMMHAKYYTLVAAANVTFEGCNFWTWRPFIAMISSNINGYSASGITLNGCSFYHSQFGSSFVHIWGNSSVNNTYIVPKSGSVNYNEDVRAKLDDAWRVNTSYRCRSVTSLYDGEYSQDKKAVFNKQVVRTLPRFFAIKKGTGNISDITYKRDTVTFQYNDDLAAGLFRYVLPGDVLGTSMTSGSLWDNPDLCILRNDTTSHTVMAIRYTDELTFDNIALYNNCFFTTQPVTGESKTGSAVISNVAKAYLLVAGDFVTFKESSGEYRIRSVDTTAKTITLMDPIRENVNGTITLYNQLLVDETAR
jgi:hypothetical protein